jgi:serine/threonine protein kinase
MGLEPFDLWPEFQIARVVELKQAEFFLDINILPRQYITGDVKLPGAVTQPLRCRILDRGVVAEGRSGVIRRVQRTPAVGAQAVCVKIPKNPQQSLCPEALVQALCARALHAVGVVGAVPAVYDIYRFADETRFSMEYVEGKSAIDAVLTSPSPDTMWLQILAQAALVLGYLEEHLHLDHRDLKADNLWIRPRPVSYSLKVGGVHWQVSAPFQVVFLDFGFSCIGGEPDGNAVVSLTDGVVPLIDPCPKEGRDLFQLIGSMWSVPHVRERASPDVAADMELLLKHRAASYIELVRKTTQSQWIYWAVSDARFKHSALHPVSLLERLAHEWYPTAGVVIMSSSRPQSARPISRPGSAALLPPHAA